MDEEHREKVALFRLSVLGPLISARLEHGDRVQHFRQAALMTYERADGQLLQVSPRTIEGWYFAWRHGGFEALKPCERSDAGSTRVITPELAELILAVKRERPRRSIKRIIRMLERDGKVATGVLKKSTVHRFLNGHGLSGRPRRLYGERRAFRHPFAGDLWMGDVMHGPRVIAPEGTERKSYLHLFIDSATRFVPGCAFRLGETAMDLDAVLKEAVAKHGLPRVLYLDRGAAQRADSLGLICAELSIRLLHCRAYDPAAKGAVERLFRTIREEVIDELPAGPLSLGELNGLLWSWLSVEYHRRVHTTTQHQPLEHWLSHSEHLRPAPPSERLDQVFLHREHRRVRKDSTVRFRGALLEVWPELCGQNVELRFDPHRPERLPQVFVEGEFYCDTIPLDAVRNSSRPRRRIAAAEEEDEHDVEPTGLSPLEQIQAEHDKRAQSPKSQGRDRDRRTKDDEE